MLGTAQCDHDSRLELVEHPPKTIHRRCQWTLCSDISITALVSLIENDVHSCYKAKPNAINSRQ